MKKEKSLVLVSSIAFFAIFGTLIGLYIYELRTNPILGGGPPTNGGYFLNLTIDYNNGTIEEYSNLNASTPLILVELKANVTYSPQYGDLLVVAINNYAGNGWKYYVDGTPPPIPAKNYQIITNNSVIKWEAQL